MGDDYLKDEDEDEDEAPSLDEIYGTEDGDEYTSDELFTRDVFRANDL